MTLHKHSERTVRRPCRTCGRTDLYWAHDTDQTEGQTACDKGHPVGKFVLIEQDGTRHTHNGAAATETRESESAPVPVPAPVIPPEGQRAGGAPVVSDPRAGAVAALLDALSAPPIDRAEITGMIREELGAVVFPTSTVVIRGEGSEPKKIEGATHPKLAAIADQAAEALGLEFYSISLSPQTPTSQIVGYMQATGEYVGTLFRKAFEHGGVFHFDEFDNGHPSILATINAALANGSMAFPDRMVKRHPDFRAIASANTYGRGADRMYVGRQALDMATLDRFSIEHIDVDESLETTLCMATGLPQHTVRQVLAYTRKLRDNAARHKMAVVISPRASVGMCRLLKAGRPWGEVVDARARRGLSDADWTKLSAGAPAVSL
jgi:cobaltochelatase CobS